MIKRALITDGKESTSLAVVKSLGKKGISVTAGDDSRFAPCRFSRYCSHFFLYPSPETSVPQFLEKLIHELRKSRAEMLFLTSDTQMPVVMKHWDEISRVTRIAAPPPETLIQVFDKSKTIHLARSLAIPIPRTVLLQSLPDLISLPWNFSFPVVLKHAQTYAWVENRLIAAPRVQYAFTLEDLKSKLGRVNFNRETVLAQEFIHGPGIGLFGLWKDGKPGPLFSHQRLREANPTGGASAEAMSIPVDSQAREISCALMKNLNWTGVAMIEFKKDLDTGELKLMEINGRFWGSLPLALRCGVDFPVLLAQMLERGTLPEPIPYPTGVRCRHLNRFLTHLLHTLKGKPRGWTGAYPGRLETLVDLLKFRQKGLFYYGLEWSDPVPEIADTLFWIQSNIMKFFRRI